MVKFKYYNTAASFATANSNNLITLDDIVFIGGSKTIHTHGVDFQAANGYDYSSLQTKVAALGSTTKPIYTSAAGTFAECSTYAGGTAVTLNGSSKAASTASFYAPTAAGTSGQILKSSGSGAPAWDSISNVLGNYVSTVGGKAGAITLKGDNTGNGTINLSIDTNKVISASINGLGNAAYTNASAYATSTLGTKADNAMPKSGGTFTGAVTLNGAPTADLHAATKKYVDDSIASGIAASDAMVFKGTLGTGGTVTAVPTTNVTKGDTYKVITAGTWAGSTCKVGDLLIALNSGATLTANTTNWAYVPSGNENETTIATSSSPNVSSTAQTGAVTLGTVVTKAVETTLTNVDTAVPTSKAVKTFVENKGYTTNTGTITSVTFNGGTAVTSGAVSLNETDPVFSASAASGITSTDITNWNGKTSNTGTVTSVIAGAGLNTTSDDTAIDGGTISTTGTLYLTKSGATAGTYGPTAAVSGNSAINVPKITVDKYGRITSVTQYSYTGTTNTDTKVTQAAAITTNKEYPVILAYSDSTSSVTNTVNKASAFKYNPSTATLTVTKIKGASGSATAVADIVDSLTWEENE